MQILLLAILLCLQSFVARQQGPETAQPLEANMAFQASTARQQVSENARPSATEAVFVSTDGGQSWQDISAGLPGDFQANCVFAGDGKVMLGSSSGLYHSRISLPAATKWEKEMFLNEPITGLFPGLAGSYARSAQNGLFQEVLGTGLWQPTLTALDNKVIRTVLESPQGAVFAGCDTGIFKSTDGGKTWKQVLAEGWVYSLVAADGVLMGSGAKGVCRSTDGGEHWDWVLTEDRASLKTSVLGGRFVAISGGGGTEQEIKADPIGTASRLRMSTDGGQTWQRLDENHSLGRRISDIEQVGEYLVCSCETGIFRSSDLGKTWKLVLPATADRTSFNFAVSGEVIYAGSVFDGC